MTLVTFKTDPYHADVAINPVDVVRVFVSDEYRHRGPNIGIVTRDGKTTVVYGESVAEVSKTLMAACADDKDA